MGLKLWVVQCVSPGHTGCYNDMLEGTKLRILIKRIGTSVCLAENPLGDKSCCAFHELLCKPSDAVHASISLPVQKASCRVSWASYGLICEPSDNLHEIYIVVGLRSLVYMFLGILRVVS